MEIPENIGQGFGRNVSARSWIRGEGTPSYLEIREKKMNHCRGQLRKVESYGFMLAKARGPDSLPGVRCSLAFRTDLQPEREARCLGGNSVEGHSVGSHALGG